MNENELIADSKIKLEAYCVREKEDRKSSWLISVSWLLALSIVCFTYYVTRPKPLREEPAPPPPAYAPSAPAAPSLHTENYLPTRLVAVNRGKGFPDDILTFPLAMTETEIETIMQRLYPTLPNKGRKEK